MDKKEALEIVKDDGFALETLSEEFKKDRDVVLEAIKTSGMGGLQNADKSFVKEQQEKLLTKWLEKSLDPAISTQQQEMYLIAACNLIR